MAETGWLGEAEVPPTGAEDRREAGLVAQIAAGNVEGPVAELYRRYGRRLYRFGMRALRNEGLAEEMVQECFVRLWRTAGRYDSRRARVGTYLFVIARSVALDLRKRSSSRELLPLDEMCAPPQFDMAEQVLNSLVMREAIAALSPPHRQVIRMAHDQDLTQSQIAERLGLPLGTVKTRMFHAMRALRAALDKTDLHAA